MVKVLHTDSSVDKLAAHEELLFHLHTIFVNCINCRPINYASVDMVFKALKFCLIPVPTLHNKIFILADFEQKNFGRKWAKNRKNWPIFFAQNLLK